MSDTEKICENILGGLASLDGKVFNREMQSSSVKLAKDERGSMVNDAVDRYLKKSLTKGHMKKIQEEYSITMRDIVKEITSRQVKQALGL